MTKTNPVSAVRIRKRDSESIVTPYIGLGTLVLIFSSPSGSRGMAMIQVISGMKMHPNIAANKLNVDLSPSNTMVPMTKNDARS